MAARGRTNTVRHTCCPVHRLDLFVLCKRSIEPRIVRVRRSWKGRAFWPRSIEDGRSVFASLPGRFLVIGSVGFIVSLEFVQVRHQFRFTCQSSEVEVQHFKRTFGWLASSPEIDQKARNDRAVGLDLDSVLIVAEQVIAAQELFEEPPSGVTSILVGM